jgi:predicted GH43/DUF377 family glycosyl hydrolase
MTVPTLQSRVLLRPDDLRPLAPDYRIVGTFNPAAVLYEDEVILLVRVAEQPIESVPGRVTAPRVVWKDDQPTWELDTFEATGIDTHDPRVLNLPDGRVRLPHISHLRLVRLDATTTEVKEIIVLPQLQPQQPWEELGIEDARITRIEDIYYITYVAISRQFGVTTALMTTRDFVTFERRGIIFPAEDKDVVLLPEKRDGAFFAFHRPTPHTWVNAPSITTSRSPDTTHWGGHRVVIAPRAGHWDSVKVGAGAPPVRLPQGWLLLYHGVETATAENSIGRYCAGAALLDGDDPSKVLARSDEPLFIPHRPHEVSGFVPDVVFPTGALLSDDKQVLTIFMGAADEVVTVQSISVQVILEHLDFA